MPDSPLVLHRTTTQDNQDEASGSPNRPQPVEQGPPLFWSRFWPQFNHSFSHSSESVAITLPHHAEGRNSRELQEIISLCHTPSSSVTVSWGGTTDLGVGGLSPSGCTIYQVFTSYMGLALWPSRDRAGGGRMPHYIYVQLIVQTHRSKPA